MWLLWGTKTPEPYGGSDEEDKYEEESLMDSSQTTMTHDEKKPDNFHQDGTAAEEEDDEGNDDGVKANVKERNHTEETNQSEAATPNDNPPEIGVSINRTKQDEKMEVGLATKESEDLRDVEEVESMKGKTNEIEEGQAIEKIAGNRNEAKKQGETKDSKEEKAAEDANELETTKMIEEAKYSKGATLGNTVDKIKKLEGNNDTDKVRESALKVETNEPKKATNEETGTPPKDEPKLVIGKPQTNNNGTNQKDDFKDQVLVQTTREAINPKTPPKNSLKAPGKDEDVRKLVASLSTSTTVEEKTVTESTVQSVSGSVVGVLDDRISGMTTQSPEPTPKVPGPKDVIVDALDHIPSDTEIASQNSNKQKECGADSMGDLVGDETDVKTKTEEIVESSTDDRGEKSGKSVGKKVEGSMVENLLSSTKREPEELQGESSKSSNVDKTEADHMTQNIGDNETNAKGKPEGSKGNTETTRSNDDDASLAGFLRAGQLGSGATLTTSNQMDTIRRLLSDDVGVIAGMERVLDRSNTETVSNKVSDDATQTLDIKSILNEDHTVSKKQAFAAACVLKATGQTDREKEKQAEPQDIEKGISLETSTAEKEEARAKLTVSSRSGEDIRPESDSQQASWGFLAFSSSSKKDPQALDSAKVPSSGSVEDEDDGKINILDKINEIEQQRQEAETEARNEKGSEENEGRVDETRGLGINENGDVIEAEEDQSNDTFLVNADVLAKTLSIYEQISEEDGILLESFRTEDFTNEDGDEDNRTFAASVEDPPSMMQLKKRKQTGREISHDSQALFDILDRDFASVTPRVTIQLGGLSRQLTAKDVKLCFVAFVDSFSPPLKSHFASEFNYTTNDYGQKPKSSEGEAELDDGDSCASGRSCDPERFSRPFVPTKIVNALWVDVIKTCFLERHDITKAIAKKVDSAHGEVFSPALSFIRDTLILLGVLDVRKVHSEASLSEEGEQMLSMEETYFVDTSRLKNETVDEVISVNQDIHQAYGEYLASKDTLKASLEKYEKRWNGVVCTCCPTDSKNRNEASYAVQMLPWNTIRANRFRDASALLSDKKFLNGRLQALGVLEGTTAQVTDAEELVLRYFEKKNSILCFESVDPDQSMIDAYERTKKDILRMLREVEESELGSGIQEDGGFNRHVRRAQIETGKALHLMGVSVGAQGHTSNEMELCQEALLLKKQASHGPSITLSDSLHCIGFALDSTGKYLEAMEYYNQALTIRRELLGSDSLRVAESLHNKGAILCENGDCDAAMSCLEEALKIRMDHYGEDHESCADTQQWIGNVMREWGKFDEALLNFQTALQTKKAILGADHDEVANTLQNMAVVLDDIGNYQLSLDCYNEALRIYTLQFGEDNIRVADTLHRVAIDYVIIEANETALETFNRAIGIRERLLEQEQRGTTDQRHVVRSLIYRDEIDNADALSIFGDTIECYEESLQLTQTLRTDNGLALSKIRHRLGELYWEVQDWDSAAESLQGALKSQRLLANTGNFDEVEVCNLLYKKGVVHLYKTEYHKAKSCFESVIYRRRKLKSNDQSAEATALYCLGVTFHFLEVHKLSLAALTEALRIWKDEHGENDVRCGYALHWIGNQEARMDRFEQASTWLRGALRTFRSNKGEVDFAVVSKTLELLGGVQEKQDDSSSALKCYAEGIRLVRAKFGENHEFSIDMLCRCGHVKMNAGLSEEAMEFFRKAIEVMRVCARPKDIQLCSTIEILGQLLETDGQYEEAKESFSEAYKLYEAAVGQDDIRAADTLQKLGRVLDTLGSHESAMQCYRECLRVQRKKLKPDHEDVADTLVYMGSNLAVCNRFDDGIKCFQQALSIQRSTHGDNSVVVAKTLLRLGKAYQVTGSFDKACVCYKECLRVTKANDKDNSKMISEVSFSMAESHEANDNYQAAIAHFEEALKIWRSSEKHERRLAIVLQKLGLVHLKVGENKKASEFLGEALDLMEEDDEQGEDLALLSLTLSGLARSFANVGAYDGAIANYQRQIDILRNDPLFHEDVSDTLYAMGSIYARLNNTEDAIQHFKDCLLVRKNIFGVSDERVARVLVNMGVLFEKNENFGPAKECFTEALRINKANANEKDVSANLQDLGRTLTKQGDHDSALESYGEALQITKRLNGSSDPQVAALLHICGNTLFEKGDFEKAVNFYKEAAKIRKAKTGVDSKETAETVCMIGRCLEKAGSYEDAVGCLKQSLGVLKVAKGKDSLDVGHCHESLGLALNANGEFKVALEHFLAAATALQNYYGKDSFELSCINFELAGTYGKLGKWDEALEYAVKSLRGRRVYLGSEAAECGDSLRQLGDIQLALKHHNEALNCYIESLRIFSAVEGRGHVSVAACLEKIGSLYLEEKQYDEATENLKRAMKIYTENFGGISSQVARTLLLLGKVEARKEARDNAIAYFKRSMQTSKELNDDEAVASALYEIGTVLQTRRKTGEAMECYKEVLRLTTSIDSSMTRAQTLSRMGGILADMDDFEDALKAYGKAKAMYIEITGEKSVEAGQTIHNIAGIYESREEFDKSRDCFTVAHSIFVERLGPDDLAVALALNNLAINHARRKGFKKARELCTESLRIRRDKLGPQHLDTCDTIYNMAYIYDEEGRVEDAMTYYVEALEAYRVALGPDDMEVANCFQHIGSLHMKKDEEDLAMRAYVEAIRIYQIHEDSTASMAKIVFELGKMYVKRREYESAIESLAQCLSIQKSLKCDECEIAATCGYIGVAYAGQKSAPEARKFFERALKIYNDTGKKDSVDYAHALLNMGELLSEEEEGKGEALRMFHEALEIYKTQCGEESDEVASTFVKIGIIHNKRVDYEEALKFLTSALKIRTALFGQNDMKVALTLFEIGKVMQEWGDSDEAIDTFDEVIRIVRTHRGQRSSLIAQALERVGSINLEKREYDAALQCIGEAIVIHKQTIGGECVEVGHALLLVAAVHDARQEEDAALASYSDALRIFKTELGPEDLSVAVALNKIGINHARRKNYEKALMLCSEAFKIRKLRLGDNHLDVADSCLNLAKVLDEWGKHDQALKFYREGLDLFKAQLGDDDVEVAKCYQHVGGIHMKQNDNRRAIQCYVETIRIYRLKKGLDNLDVALALFNLGRVYGKTAEYDKATSCFQESLRIRQTELGDAHLDVVAVQRYIEAIERKRRRL